MLALVRSRTSARQPAAYLAVEQFPKHPQPASPAVTLAPSAMLANILLLLLVFGAARWKKHPYAAALIFGLVKGGLYFVVPLRSQPLAYCVINGLIGFTLFTALSAALVYFFRRLDRYPPSNPTYSTLGPERAVFKWEYLPLSALVFLLIFGELLLEIALRPAPASI